MKSIGETVEEKLAARGGEDATALWRRLWALYEQGGADAVEAGLRELLEEAQVEADGPAAPEGP